MSFPQLRVRSGYSFRESYGKIDDILKRAKEVDADFVAMVDNNTFGHARFEQAAKKAGITPGFGMEVPIYHDPEQKHKPRAWMLATDPAHFYTNTTIATRQGGMSDEDFAASQGVLRFSGAALGLLQPDQFDYVDVNPASLVLARRAYEYACEHSKPMVITSHNDMPSVDDMRFATAWKVRDSVGNRQISDVETLWASLQHVMPRDTFERAVHNTRELAYGLRGVELKKAPIIHLEGDLLALCRAGQEERIAKGHISAWNDTYEARLLDELRVINLKGFASYFLVVSDLVRYAKQHMLVGPGRGSAAGSLVCYLTMITELDPIKYGLLFQRFIDESRADFPDIDLDFPDTKRDMVFDYLRKKYGAAHVSKLGNINTLQGKSVVSEVHKKFGIDMHATFGVRDSMPKPKVGEMRHEGVLKELFEDTEAGRVFAERYPEAAHCMRVIEAHPSHTGVHAGAALVCNDPISHYCTVTADGIAQIDKIDAEYLNLLKIDALGLRTLGIIEDSGVVDAETLYGLVPNDQAVFDVLNDGKFSGIFQFEGDAARAITQQVHVDAFSKIDNLTALARPGPMGSGMVNKYVERVTSTKPIPYAFPELEAHLGETRGILLYQEQCMSIVRDIGGFDWANTSEVRRAIGKSKGADYLAKYKDGFLEGAVARGIDKSKADTLWEEMVAFGAYGFNKAHSAAYALVSYWSMYMKQYHRLEFAAACLRSAKDEEQTIAILRELAKEGVEYTAIDPEFSDMNWRVADGRLVGGIMNAKGFGAVKAAKYIEARNARHEGEKQAKAFEKMAATLAKAEVKFADLNEGQTKWGHFYRDPSLCGVTSGRAISYIKDARENEISVMIAKLAKKELGDQNEPARVKKRGGKIVRGNSQFLDMFMLDDSIDSGIRFRVQHEDFIAKGKQIAENDKPGAWYLVKARRLKNIPMFVVINIKRLDEPENQQNEDEEQ